MLLSNIVTVAYKLLFLQNVGLCFLFTSQWFYILLWSSFCVSYNLNLSIFVLDNVLLINISKWNCNKICFRKLENQLIVEVIVFSKSLSQSQKIKGEWRKEHKAMNKYIIIEEMILRLAGQSQQVPRALSFTHSFHGNTSPTNWPARIWVASQLCRWEHFTSITEVMG